MSGFLEAGLALSEAAVTILELMGQPQRLSYKHRSGKKKPYWKK